MLMRYAKRLAWMVPISSAYATLSAPSLAVAGTSSDFALAPLVGGQERMANPYAIPVVLLAIFVVSLALMALMRFWRTGRKPVKGVDGATHDTKSSREAEPPRGSRPSKPVSLALSGILAIALVGLAGLAYGMMDALSQPTARCVITAMPGIPGSELKPAGPGESSEYHDAIIEANEKKTPLSTRDFMFYKYDGPPLRLTSDQESCNIAIADLPDIFPIVVPTPSAENINFRSSVLYDPTKIDPVFLERLREEYPEEQYSAESADNIWCELCKERAERARETMGVLKFVAPIAVAIIFAIAVCLSAMSRRTELLIEDMGMEDGSVSP